ncbi:hypothetical protein ABEB36_008415 [Hypothenemus hampei]|uniref:Uncharacterized protein n=1 Tax=Hypothenemus hampei TaxID=57062 RepID=A0ABD1ELR6_HYPHA
MLINIFVCVITFGHAMAVGNFLISTTDITKITEIFLFSMTQVGLVNKLLNFQFRFQTIVLLDKMVSTNIFKPSIETEQKMFENAFRKCQIVLNPFLVLCFLTVASFGGVPALANIKMKTKIYPFPGKFPFNPDNYFLLIFGLEILQTKLIFTFKYYFRYVLKIEKAFSYGIFVQFLCSAVIICLTGFQLLVVSAGNAELVRLVIYLLVMTYQLVLYCWYGHILMEKSKEITNACYTGNWHNMSVKEQKMLIMVMERAKRPVSIRAAGIFQLNLSTLMTILRSSYSYFAVLQRLYVPTY